jgi:hypothetical protein
MTHFCNSDISDLPSSHRRRWCRPSATLLLALLLPSCAAHSAAPVASDFVRAGRFEERVRVLDLYPRVTATFVAPGRLDPTKRIDLILYALPNGNSTAETMGRTLEDGVGWRHDIQHIAAQTRALRVRGLDQAVVVYLEAEGRSWPEWRRAEYSAICNRKGVSTRSLTSSMR